MQQPKIIAIATTRRLQRRIINAGARALQGARLGVGCIVGCKEGEGVGAKVGSTTQTGRQFGHWLPVPPVLALFQKMAPVGLRR